MLNWERIVQEYIIKYSDRIRKTTQPLREHFGINYFTYHKIEENSKYTVLVDRPDWAEHYVSSKLYLIDPYLRHPSVYGSGFCLIGTKGSAEYKTRVIESGKKVLNMDLGLIYIQKTQHAVEFFGFTADAKNSTLHHLYLNHPSLLKSFATYFKKELKKILFSMDEEAGLLTLLKGKDFFCNHSMNPKLPSSTCFDYFRDTTFPSDVEKIKKLSAREKQCLKLFQENKSAKETATLLNLSPRTVEFYFENIKHKLCLYDKKEILTFIKNWEDVIFI